MDPENNQQPNENLGTSSPGTTEPKNTQYSGVNKLITILLIVVLAYMVGYKSGKNGYVFQPKEFKIVNQSEQPKNVDYQLLWDAISVINDKYIDKPIDQQKILYGAIQGAVSATGDPYTDFFPPKELESFKTDLKGSFDGIGAEVGKKENQIVVVAPLDGTPAQKAGLKPQDIILEVDGQSTQGWSVDEAVSKIRGEKGTEVKLNIYRQGTDAPFDVKIVRDKIEIKSVKWEFKNVGDKKIAVITVSKFGDDTDKLFNQAVNETLSQGAKGIVLDLRNNPGGYLQTAVNLASNWISLGTVVVKEQHSDGSLKEYKSLGNSRLSGTKTVVLLNGGSASASEILAGALHDYKVATLIGEKSFGKGSVQELIDLKDGSAVKVTVAKWITPNGKNLNKDGLDPDVAIKPSDEDVKNNKDVQMDKALEEVSK